MLTYAEKRELKKAGMRRRTWALGLTLCVVALGGFSHFWRRPVFPAALLTLCPALKNTQPYEVSSQEMLLAVHDAAIEHMVDYELVLAVMAAESRCTFQAKSNAGAVGLMQLMPATAKWLGVADPRIPRDNIFGGAKYLSLLIGQFNGNTELALAAYNAGPRKVRHHKGIPPYKETKQFVGRVLEYYKVLRGEGLTTPV